MALSTRKLAPLLRRNFYESIGYTSVEKLCAKDSEQAQALSRRIRMSTLPYTERRVEW
jgi:hypothetical protein